MTNAKYTDTQQRMLQLGEDIASFAEVANRCFAITALEAAMAVHELSTKLNEMDRRPARP